MTRAQATTLTNAGAKALDERRPGWASLIDVGRLDMTSCTDCVLGQLGGLYVWSGETIYGDLAEEAAAYGFDLMDPRGRITQTVKERMMRDFRVLQDAWIEQIAERAV